LNSKQCQARKKEWKFNNEKKQDLKNRKWKKITGKHKIKKKQKILPI
jgi:hypothetical protein